MPTWLDVVNRKLNKKTIYGGQIRDMYRDDGIRIPGKARRTSFELWRWTPNPRLMRVIITFAAFLFGSLVNIFGCMTKRHPKQKFCQLTAAVKQSFSNCAMSLIGILVVLLWISMSLSRYTAKTDPPRISVVWVSCSPYTAILATSCETNRQCLPAVLVISRW